MQVRELWLIAACRILAFTGAVANTAGFLSFFTFEGLAPYRWRLIMGGLAVTTAGELAAGALTARLTSAAAALDGDD